jgi:PAS domain S-box-containing protein
MQAGTGARADGDDVVEAADERSEASLVADLAELAEAGAFLGQLAAAFFPGGGELGDLTWNEVWDAAAAKDVQDPERRLREAEARFRTLVEQIPAVTFMAVLGEGKNEVYVSPHVEQMLGYTQEEWLAEPFRWYWRLHPDDRAMWNEEFTRGCQTGGPFRAECRFFARDGRVVWVHGEARVAKDERGRPMFLQGVAFDITESKRAQEVLLTEAVRSAKIEEELEIARRVQTSILPTKLAVEGLEIATAMEPASDVGGDYYDVLPVPGGAWISIGDVSGHGLNSGLIMLMVQSAMVAICRARPEATPRDVLSLLNDVLYDNIRERLGTDDHVTFTLFRYAADGRIWFAGAHEDIIIVRHRTGALETIRPPGTWLGARRNVSAVTVNSWLRLEDQDLVVIYTDGITEAMNAAREQFDLHRLCATVLEVRTRTCEEIRDHVMTSVHAWMATQSDDMSLVVIRYRAT